MNLSVFPIKIDKILRLPNYQNRWEVLINEDFWAHLQRLISSRSHTSVFLKIYAIDFGVKAGLEFPDLNSTSPHYQNFW